MRQFYPSPTLLLAGTLLLCCVAHAADLKTQFSKFDSQAKALLQQMTVDEKIGQMVQPDQEFLKSIDDIQTYHFGSILSGGNSDPKTGNDLQSWTEMFNRLETASLKSRLYIPIIYGIDAVHGHNNVEGATIFPQNIGLGATRDAPLLEKIGEITAAEVRATGIQWGFAPCVTVPQDIRWGRTYEGYSESPDIVKPLGEAIIRGLQSENLADPKHIVACAKHLAGDGGTVFGTGLKGMMDHGDTKVDEAAFRRIHLPGYVDAINAGVGTIMPSYSSWNGVKCSANKHLMTDIIKNELGFEGFLISDYNAIDEIPGDFKEQIRVSVLAGMDMFMEPQKYAAFFDGLKQLVTEGAVPMTRIDDAVLRILRVKAAMGVLDPKRNQLADPELKSTFGSPEHRQVAREAVRESLVILKNDRQVLPLSKTAKRIHVAGKNADDLGNQCGGWTVSWQGKSGNIMKGTTIRQGMAEVAPSVNLTYSKDGSGAKGADVGVLVIGEKPYAEMFGDRKISDFFLDAEDKTALKNMKSAGIPVVVVVISGRPLFIDDVLDQADAWVAAWLPGTEGGGVADLLFGTARPQGKLSFTWPKSTSTSLHIGDPGYQTQFPLGFGLSF
jgi:beta-glucosidase